ncbi:PTS mannose transporter subunit IID [Listeria grandensis]|uniref:PTS system mannose-specific transporter subunit IID n=2 Tax=Listeria grandensis TaxID=1494963 RepID=W7BD49_9LIST|nr:PTS mannose transporter subunit IID [Listeria grandensis]EUJ23782.1 PTS system mannose-specific transporter subunit IID [Listeria grandensis FSL F6-0971]MBC1474217.1 PTS mannose transporter subunit IID [Listeria grandensis]MBC1936592.1 PTS mannose transporter subunit IID [Listeria grandensis]MBC6315126.1 PTS mannose transporter subunit IID [Listeria grandensis]
MSNETAKVTVGEKKLTKGDLMSVFIRSNLFQGSWNFERMQALGFCFTVVPIINRLYEGEERTEAIKRHLEFFNTHPYMGAPILGVTAAMEEQKSNGAPIDQAAINGIKVGLMGPLAGVGDPIFWGTIRPVFAALGASFASTGSIFGPLLFFVLFNAVRLGFRYWGVFYGYRKGTDVVSDMAGGVIQKLTEGASILGLFVMGGLVNKWTNIDIPVVVSKTTNQEGKTTTTTVQDILDSLMPGILALGLTFACMWLLKKKINALWIIFMLFALGIVGYVLGIFAVPGS